ncbi:IS30 family transposase, partial [Enterococcus faecium]
NHIPRKSLNYQTPLEVFLSYVNGKFVSLNLTNNRNK